jgi:hypothetical protein
MPFAPELSAPSRFSRFARFAPACVIAVAFTAGCSGGSSPAAAEDSGAAASNDAGGSGFAPGSSGGGSSGGGFSNSDDAGSPLVPDATATTSGEAGANADASSNDAGQGGSILNGRQVLVWIPTYLGSFSDNLNQVTGTTPKAFTQVSPDFYNLNYDYASGPAKISGESFSGLSVAQVAQQVHGAGMLLVPLVYAGAGNSGTDQGIQNVITDSPAGTQNNFITAMVQEAQTRQYDGWNLDWEVGNTGYTQYGVPYIQFMAAFKKALHAQNMILTVDLGDWYTRQCGSDGLVDLAQIGPSVDAMIMEDYAGSLGSPDSTCPTGTPPATQSCNQDFGSLMNVMCDVSPLASASIGMIQSANGGGTNPFADQALNAAAAAGFTSVAIWPDDTPFLSNQNIPNGGTWYSLLANYLAGQ